MRVRYRPFTLLVLTVIAFGQDKNTTEAPDRAAYRQAVLQEDARDRVNSLRKFLVDYPKSGRASAAQNLILRTLVINWPDQTAEIREQVKSMTRGVSGNARAERFDTVAGILVVNGVANGTAHSALMETAEKVQSEALKQFDEKRFLAAEKRDAAAAKVPVSEAVLRHYTDEVHSELLSDMGLIEIARGNSQKAQPLLEQARRLDPGNSDATAALGALALQAGRESEALELLADAQLNGTLTPEHRKQLEELYRKLHPGDGLDAWLDQQYRPKFPDTIHPEPYSDRNKSHKTVIAELFTGAQCGPCAGADIAMDAAMERYPKSDLAVLMYHEHIPEPDPMTNPATVGRLAFYEIGHTPTLVVDGETLPGGGGDRGDAKNIYERFSPKIEDALSASSDLKLAVSARRDGGRVLVHAQVDSVPASAKAPRLQIVLAEKQIRYSGDNGIRFHPMVVRAMAGANGEGFAIDPSGSKAFDATFDIPKISADLKTYLDNFEAGNDRFGPIHFSEEKNSIDPANAAIVVFVQDAGTKHILQAAYAEADGSEQAAR